MPELLITEGVNKGAVFEFHGGRVPIGRADDNRVRLDDRTVSRYHAVIIEGEDGWHIVDLGSHNGTLVNGRSVTTASLRHLDRVQLGNVSLLFRERKEAAGETTVRARARTSAEVTQTIRVGSVRGLLSGQKPPEGVPSEELRLDYLLAMAELATSAQDLEALFGGVAQCLRAVLRAERVIPILREPDGSLRPYLALEGAFADGLETLGLDVGLIRRSSEEGSAIAARGVSGGPHVACVPLRVGLKALGLIYCEKRGSSVPFAGEELRYLFAGSLLVGVAIESIRYRDQAARRAGSLRRQLQPHFDMVGASERMQGVFAFIRKAAPTDVGVLICGESGTGKELVAHAIHQQSRRRDAPLEVVNCGAVPEGLIESELFGHVRGAFTGAVADKPGRFELADGGTLFLDEVAELPPGCQVRLLRALEEGKIRRVGDTRDRLVDVRLIAATNRDPERAVEEGQLRRDLFYRLDRLRIALPPLRERGEDVALLANHFLERIGRDLRRHGLWFHHEVLAAFSAYEWPGNVRELRNVVERMVIMSEGPELGPELLPAPLRQAGRPAAPERIGTLAEVEKDHILRALEATGGNKKRAASLLGIDRSTLYARLRRYGLHPG